MKVPKWLSRTPTEGPPPVQSDAHYGAELAISVEPHEGRTRVVVAGELDLSNADQLAGRLHDAEEPRPACLEIDLRGLGFIDSSGLAELFAANRRAKETGRRVVVVMDHGPIERVLNLARIEDVMEVVHQSAN